MCLLSPAQRVLQEAQGSWSLGGGGSPTLHQRESLALTSVAGAGGRVPVPAETLLTPAEAVTELHPSTAGWRSHPHEVMRRAQECQPVQRTPSCTFYHLSLASSVGLLTYTQHLVSACQIRLG